MIKPKKAIPESGDNYAYHICSCGHKTLYRKKNPTQYEVYKWLNRFKCCGNKTPKKKLLTRSKKKELALKEMSKGGKKGSNKRWNG